MRQIGDEFRIDPFNNESLAAIDAPKADFSAHYKVFG